MSLGQEFRRFTRSAAATTVMFVGGVALLIVLLHSTWTGPGADDDLTSTFEFGLWVGLCGATAGVWTIAFVIGLRDLATLLPKDTCSGAVRVGLGALAVMVLGAGAGIVMFLVGGDTGFEVAVPGWNAWQKAIPILGIAAAGPWILITWWTHDCLTEIRSTLPVDALTADNAQPVFAALRGTWSRVERCTSAMVAILTSGVLTTGALRLALVAGGAEDVPAEQHVLAYGLFFAFLLALVVVPLLLAYRRTARQYVGVRYPVTDPPGDMDKAASVEDALYLSRGPFRDPWALLGILTPAVTGALAAYLPGVGG